MNILMAGVGGQGIILASDVLSEVMMRHGLDVKKSEIHGMAQRGGSVVSHIRFSKAVSSPIISLAECDMLLSFEELETARYTKYMNSSTNVIINKFRQSPPEVIAGAEVYPDILPIIREKTQKVHTVDGTALCHEIGNPKGVNIVLLGVLSKFLDAHADLWIETLNDMLAEKIRKKNIEGFLKGRALNTN